MSKATDRHRISKPPNAHDTKDLCAPNNGDNEKNGKKEEKKNPLTPLQGGNPASAELQELQLAFGGYHLKITEKQHNRFRLAFPGMDLPREYAKMDSWLEANPDKPKKNHASFAQKWLTGALKDNPGDGPPAARAEEDGDLDRAKLYRHPETKEMVYAHELPADHPNYRPRA